MSSLLCAPFCSSPQVVTVVTVTGAIDLATVPQLRSRFAAVPDRGTVVDLAGVTLLAAAGLSALLDLHHRLHRAGAQLVLLDTPSHVRRMLVAIGVDTTLLMTPEVTEAAELAAAPHHSVRDRSPATTTPATGDDPTSAAIIRQRGASPRASPRHLRALPVPELVDPH